jgi:preprotein translocase subunit YajC
MFISTAYAQAANAPAPSFIEQMVPFLFIFAIFWFFIIRPQHRRQKDHQSFITKMKRGDAVLTTGGMFGTIEGITDQFVTLEVSDGVRVRILKNQIASSVNEENKQ